MEVYSYFHSIIFCMICYTMFCYDCKDLGHGEFDDSRQVLKLEQPSINTTRHLVSEMSRHDLVLHVGDLSYADGYEPIVMLPYFLWV